MIYISAQPAIFYFKWQIEIQLFNFHKLGIKKNKIHVLLGYTSSGIDKRVIKLAMENKDKAEFYFYEDTRVDRDTYASTIRPHIIKKHFEEHSYLQNEAIFFHDSDIIFRELPNFKKLLKGDTWYFSDTRSYLSSSLISKFGSTVLKKMCEIVGISPLTVIKNENNTGGAQYLMKNVNSQFWEKHEKDSYELYRYLHDNKSYLEKLYKRQSEGHDPPNFTYLQHWCADMWSLLWNSLLFNKDVKIHSELDFCWADCDIERWNNTKIMHNAGVTVERSDELFYKNKYENFSPFVDDLSFVSKDYCSMKYVQEIKSYLMSKRTNLTDTTFIFFIKEPKINEIKLLKISIEHLIKHFITTILVIELGSHNTISNSDFSEEVEIKYFDIQENLQEKEILIQCIEENDNEYICLSDYEIVIDPEQIVKSIDKIKVEQYHISFPHNGSLACIKDHELVKKNVQNHDFFSLKNIYHKLGKELYIQPYNGYPIIRSKDYLNNYKATKYNISEIDVLLDILLKGNNIHYGTEAAYSVIL